MQAFETKSECGSAMLTWQGQPHDAVTRVANCFLHNKDADLDLVRRAHSTLVVAKTLSEPRVQDDQRATLNNIVKYLDKYIHEQKKR